MLQFFSEAPSSLEEVLERQAIIKSFIRNWSVLERFNYQNIDFREAFEYCTYLSNKKITKSSNSFSKRLFLLLQNKTIKQKKSKLIQLVLLFDHLSSRFFNSINSSLFPPSFQEELKAFYLFVEQADIQGVSAIVKQNRFTNRQALRFEETLLRLEPRLLHKAWEALFTFEAHFSIAKGVLKYGFAFPHFQEGVFTITEFYHPLLKHPVKNSLSLTEVENMVLLTGPNMSGKSTLLKAIGLCVYLAHLGLAVPAAAFTLPFYSLLSININSKDDLMSGYSHFMHELMALKAAVQHAAHGSSCFVVFDEIFKGTDADDAQEILQETIDGLKPHQNSLFFFSTHLQNLKNHLEVQAPEIKKCHISCTLQDNKATFNYRLAEGWSEVKIGKLLFAQTGLRELLRK
ncbi:MutS-related protein [Rufibacter immobilis]|uniref:MutS-related protein n=1 Tax=Rufibacter immobilis TaxID=1348778 RepID=UPI001C83DE91|nr:hypothetical protein [Rufibacter immobilis]